MTAEEGSFVKTWSSSEGDVYVTPHDYEHIKKGHFKKRNDKSYFCWSPEEILLLLAETLASPDVYFKQDIDGNDWGVFLKTFPDEIGYSKLQKPCRTARAIVLFTSSGMRLILTFYPQDIIVRYK